MQQSPLLTTIQNKSSKVISGENRDTVARSPRSFNIQVLVLEQQVRAVLQHSGSIACCLVGSSLGSGAEFFQAAEKLQVSLYHAVQREPM